jgi:hypothetical protein
MLHEQKTKEFWTKANRKAVVCSTKLVELKHGDLMRPRLEYLTGADGAEMRYAITAGEPIWAVEVVFQEGLDEVSSFWILETSKQKADAVSKRYQNGDEIDLRDGLLAGSTDFDADNLSFYTNVSILGRGEAPYGILFEALQGAGVLGRDTRA